MFLPTSCLVFVLFCCYFGILDFRFCLGLGLGLSLGIGLGLALALVLVLMLVLIFHVCWIATSLSCALLPDVAKCDHSPSGGVRNRCTRAGEFLCTETLLLRHRSLESFCRSGNCCTSKIRSHKLGIEE
jgi:hypothetical protein